jgi:hypothetical protein
LNISIIREVSIQQNFNGRFDEPARKKIRLHQIDHNAYLRPKLKKEWTNWLDLYALQAISFF